MGLRPLSYTASLANIKLPPLSDVSFRYIIISRCPESSPIAITAISLSPSLSKSTSATLVGSSPTSNCNEGANPPPGRPRKIPMTSESGLETTASSILSPVRSPTAISSGPVATGVKDSKAQPKPKPTGSSCILPTAFPEPRTT